MASVETSANTSVYIGRVKWFNNKSGYGFITITDGPKSGTDVFVHHTSVTVEKEQYRYLVQGEYVSLTLAEVTGGTHEFQAGQVTGINGGQLMCETLNETRQQVRPQVRRQQDYQHQPREHQEEYAPRRRQPDERREQRSNIDESLRTQRSDGEWKTQTYQKTAGQRPQTRQPQHEQPRQRQAPGRGQGQGRGTRQGRGEQR